MKFFLVFAALFVFSSGLLAQSQTPTFAAAAMDGAMVDTAKLKGKVVVLNLWFINCPNCVEEIKLLNALVDEYKGRDDIAFVSLAASKKTDLVKFLQKNPFKYQTVPDATVLILSKFGTPDKSGEINIPFPMHYILDREGKIVLKEQGIKGVAAVRNELRNGYPKGKPSSGRKENKSTEIHLSKITGALKHSTASGIF